MRRLLPLLVFALLPTAVAAPVPPAPPSEFGADGLLTRADLDKVKFDSRPDPAGEARPKLNPEPEERIKVFARPGPVKPRPTNRYDVAVHLPVTRVREGDPAPAYIVLRNNRDEPLWLRSRVDVCDPEPRVCGDDVRYTIRDRDTGKPVVSGGREVTNCGGAALVVIPADGFYCVRADLNRLAGRVLPPGAYEIEWGYGALRSAPVAFTVVARPGAKPAPLAKLPQLSVYHLTEDVDSQPEAQPEERAGLVRWPACELDEVPTDDFAAALAVGPHGVYAPDLRAIPQADKLVEAWLDWLPYRDGDRVRVTLRAAPAQRAVCVEEVPQLYLLLETPEEVSDRRLEQQARKLIELKRDAVRALPLTIEANLPDGWRDQLAASGTVRLSVLLVAGRIELPRAHERTKRQEALAEAAPRGDTPVWRGIVRTNSAELRVQLPQQTVVEKP